jgi:hypothetical protein
LIRFVRISTGASTVRKTKYFSSWQQVRNYLLVLKPWIHEISPDFQCRNLLDARFPEVCRYTNSNFSFQRLSSPLVLVSGALPDEMHVLSHCRLLALRLARCEEASSLVQTRHSAECAIMHRAKIINSCRLLPVHLFSWAILF